MVGKCADRACFATFRYLHEVVIDSNLGQLKPSAGSEYQTVHAAFRDVLLMFPLPMALEIAMHRESRSRPGVEKKGVTGISLVLVIALIHGQLRASNDDVQRSQAYLAEGQRLTRTGSWGWHPAKLKTT